MEREKERERKINKIRKSIRHYIVMYFITSMKTKDIGSISDWENKKKQYIIKSTKKLNLSRNNVKKLALINQNDFKKDISPFFPIISHNY